MRCLAVHKHLYYILSVGFTPNILFFHRKEWDFGMELLKNIKVTLNVSAKSIDSSHPDRNDFVIQTFTSETLIIERLKFKKNRNQNFSSKYRSVIITLNNLVNFYSSTLYLHFPSHFPLIYLC